jgi:hypothetical protein
MPRCNALHFLPGSYVIVKSSISQPWSAVNHVFRGPATNTPPVPPSLRRHNPHSASRRPRSLSRGLIGLWAGWRWRFGCRGLSTGEYAHQYPDAYQDQHGGRNVLGRGFGHEKG